MPASKGSIPWNKGRDMVAYPQCGFQKGHPQYANPENLKGYTAWNKGKSWSKEVREKLSKAHIGIQAKENHPMWKGGLPKCKRCGKTLTTYKSKTGYCRKCYALIFVGEKSPKWIKNRLETAEEIRKDERGDLAYYYWRTAVLERDNNKCRISNKDCSGYCEVHHILPWRDYLELRYNINNGITLCQAHHPKKRAEEKRLIPFFQELVSVSNEQV